MKKNKNGYLAVDIPQGGSFYPLFPGQIGIWNVSIKVDWKLEDPEKNPPCKDENWQQTQPSCDTMSRTWT